MRLKAYPFAATIHDSLRTENITRAVTEELLLKKTLQNQCRPSGSEALPRGIVQDKSNFQMESLGGNPGRKKAVRPSKSLLAIPVGIKQKAVVDKLVAKVTSL